MEEQQDKDCYHYTSQDEIHKANHVEAITRDLEEARQKEVSNQEEIGERLITLCRREQRCRRKRGLSQMEGADYTSPKRRACMKQGLGGS
jgi:hypothetical protein